MLWGGAVALKTDYDNLSSFDKVYISKVFTDTYIQEDILSLPNVEYGGTGFYYDKAPKLPYEIEHHIPDYHLYDDFVREQIQNGKNPKEFAYYTDYSIGFMTRGCFRHCSFCVNRNYNRVEIHSPLEEFYDQNRPKICLLDDNFLGCPKWKDMLTELKNTKKPFQFKQGLDERILTDEKCSELFSARYDGDYIFAFDNIEDMPIIEEKLKMIRKHTNAIPKFYCFCGFDRQEKWDSDFWKQDIFDLFKRIEMLMKYRCLPYIMRFNRYEESPYRGMYITIARWCNQPSFFKKKTLREFGESNGSNSACNRYLNEFESKFPDVSYYYDLRFNSV